MKKLTSYTIGAALFIAGYHHTRRQMDYIAARATPNNSSISPAFTPPSKPALPRATSTFAFHLAKSF